jgi:hypothetical protein
MCTVSWTAARDGYELFFNRDELNTRAEESAPTLGRCDGIAFVAPADGERGGTWLLANECGVTVGLLNDYACPWRPAAGGPRYSRGHVVLACAAAVDHASVMMALRAQPLACIAPFHLLAITPEEGPMVAHWQGLRMTTRRAADLVQPLTSSSFATDEVIAARQQRFPWFVRTPRDAEPAELAAFHRQHARAAGAHSVLMRRPDAATRSITHVEVRGDRVQMSYRSVQWNADGPVLREPEAMMLSRRRLTA